MAELTRSEIEHIAGPLDDDLVLEILETGATSEEVAEAFEWLNADDVVARELHRGPAGRVSALCEILSRSILGDEDEAPDHSGA